LIFHFAVYFVMLLPFSDDEMIADAFFVVSSSDDAAATFRCFFYR